MFTLQRTMGYSRCRLVVSRKLPGTVVDRALTPKNKFAFGCFRIFISAKLRMFRCRLHYAFTFSHIKRKKIVILVCVFLNEIQVL